MASLRYCHFGIIPTIPSLINLIQSKVQSQLELSLVFSFQLVLTIYLASMLLIFSANVLPSMAIIVLVIWLAPIF